MNSKINEYVRQPRQWQKEIKKLRKILLDCGLEEEFKWSKPCYSLDGNNVVIIQPFKEYLALMFFKGVLMKDPKGILKKIGANSRIGRQIRFTTEHEIGDMESVLKKYIKEAMRVEKSGQKVDLKDEPKAPYCEELKQKLAKDSKFRAAFEALTPGRQRGYNIYFSSAKQAETRESRIEKCTAKILAGKGFNER